MGRLNVNAYDPQTAAVDLMPNVLSCPECGARRKDGDFDPEGACECVKGHQFWDTNSPEWQIISRLQRAELIIAAHGDWMAQKREVLDAMVGLAVALRKLVNARLPTDLDPEAHFWLACRYARATLSTYEKLTGVNGEQDQ
jgi:hypothetical protein